MDDTKIKSEQDKATDRLALSDYPQLSDEKSVEKLHSSNKNSASNSYYPGHYGIESEKLNQKIKFQLKKKGSDPDGIGLDYTKIKEKSIGSERKEQSESIENNTNIQHEQKKLVKQEFAKKLKM